MRDIFIKDVPDDFLTRAEKLCAGIVKVEMEFNPKEEQTMQLLSRLLTAAVDRRTATDNTLLTVDFPS
jgi:elongation factor P--beta-lysine ligase